MFETPASGAQPFIAPPFSSQPPADAGAFTPDPAQAGAVAPPAYGQLAGGHAPSYAPTAPPAYGQMAPGPVPSYGPVYPPTPPPAPRKKRTGWLVAVLAICVLGLIAVGVAVLRPAITAAPAASAPPRFVMAELPGYDAAVSETRNTINRYVLAAKTDKPGFLLPGTPAGRAYVLEFQADLAERFATLQKMGERTSADRAVLRKDLNALLGTVRTLEKNYLAQAPLGRKGQFKDPSTGKTHPFTGAASPKAENARLEALARTFVGEPDAEGSYIPSAEQLVRSFGLSVNWDFAQLTKSCPSTKKNDPDVVAAFCTAAPRLIYGNRETTGAAVVFYSPVVVSVMKHELSHYRITQICGTPVPSRAGDSVEAVTNSYAVLFLGASYDDLQPFDGSPHPEYRMTPQSDAIAKKLHAGSCS